MNIQSAQMQSRMSTRGSFRLHQSFSFSFENIKLYLLSFGVPAKPGIAKDLNEADDIGRKAVADFIDSLLLKKSVFHIPHKMLQATCEVKQEEVAQFTKRKQPDESLKERLW